jgi:hypothetical protein
MTTKQTLEIGNAVEVISGQWSECRGTVTAIERGDWQGAAAVWVWVKLTGVPAEMRFPRDMIAAPSEAEQETGRRLL